VRRLPRRVTEALASSGADLTILVIRLGALGDVLRTLLPVRLLRRALPRARIHWVVDARWRSVLEGHPDLDGVVAMPRAEWRALARQVTGWPGLLRAVGTWRRRLVALAPGLALDFHGNLRSGLASFLSSAPVRLGYSGHQQKEGNRWFNTHHCPSGDRRTPRLERNLDLLRALGLATAPLPDSGLRLVAQGEAAALEVLDRIGSGPRFAVLSPGVSPRQAYKKPPPALLAAAASRLARNDVHSIVVWGPGEEADAERVVALARGDAVLAPPTDLAALAALLARARLFVGGDSGPLHLACAVGCPVLGLYGPTDPEVNRPWGVPHRALSPPGRTYTGIKRLDRRAGFEGLSADPVIEAVDELLAAGR
jgi:ADP-heptose:LPS heptosyltransferase